MVKWSYLSIMKTNIKHIIIDPQQGIFLGTMKNHEANFGKSDPKDNYLIALFSTNNLMDITKAVAFFHKEDALQYMQKYITPKYPQSFIADIEDNTTSTYVDIIAIVKAGYGQYAWDMIDAMPMPSQMDH